MCTVTFYPLSESEFALSSNRDESPKRATIPPRLYENKAVHLMYPKDMLAGGTWIGASSKKRILTLLNGGFVPHKRKKFYRMSRGIIVKELMETDAVLHYLKSFSFEDIEPFTIILFDQEKEPKLYQIVWDENQLHIENLEIKPHIWSATPLYTREEHALHKKWFEEFNKNKKYINIDALWRFHHRAGGGNEISLLIDRDAVMTKSITQLIINKRGVKSKYHDLESDKTHSNILLF